MASQGDEPIGLVLAGGGARGAYEMGALSVLLPALAERGEHVRITVGTSVGALNTAYVAANAHRPVGEVVDGGLALWREARYGDLLRPLFSVAEAGKALRYGGQVLGIHGLRLDSLLDPVPLRKFVAQRIAFEQLQGNVESGAVEAVGVAATSALTSRTVVFHAGGGSPRRDDARGIDYVKTALNEEHVLASAAIPTVFPPVHVETPRRARGWYFDGGTRLNTPTKPALRLGARRVIVIGLNSSAAAPARLASEHKPDALEGSGQLLQAVLADPLAADIRNLAGVNSLLANTPDHQHKRQRVPYIFIAPRGHDALGRLAARVFHRYYAGAREPLPPLDLATRGRLRPGGSSAGHGELLSYLFFAPEFSAALIRRGRADARQWLAAPHERGPWETGPLGLDTDHARR